MKKKSEKFPQLILRVRLACKQSARMSLYLFTVVIALLSVLLYKIRHYFNTDIYRNYGSAQVPEVKNGFKVTFMGPGENF